MDPLWSLEVEGFGRIAHARIEQAPLIVLVGKNNSGKSYMASLLWGLMNLGSSSVRGMEIDADHESLSVLYNALDLNLRDGSKSIFQLEQPHLADVQRRIEIAFCKEKLLSDIFSDEGMELQNICVSFNRQKQIELQFKDSGATALDSLVLGSKDAISYGFVSDVRVALQSEFRKTLIPFAPVSLHLVAPGRSGA